MSEISPNTQKKLTLKQRIQQLNDFPSNSKLFRFFKIFNKNPVKPAPSFTDSTRELTPEEIKRYNETHDFSPLEN